MGFLGLVTCWLCHWCPGDCSALAARPPEMTMRAPAPEKPEQAAPAPAAPTPPEPPPAPIDPKDRAQMADDAVLEVVEGSRPSFAACVRLARKRDPLLGTVKIDLQLDVDRDGAVTGARLALEDPKLQSCVERVARGLHFAAPGRAATAAIAFFAQ